MFPHRKFTVALAALSCPKHSHYSYKHLHYFHLRQVMLFHSIVCERIVQLQLFQPLFWVCCLTALVPEAEWSLQTLEVRQQYAWARHLSRKSNPTMKLEVVSRKTITLLSFLFISVYFLVVLRVSQSGYVCTDDRAAHGRPGSHLRPIPALHLETHPGFFGWGYTGKPLWSFWKREAT